MQTNLYIYSGLGNIIGILDSLSADIKINSKDVVELNQKQGIAFDQLIVVLPPLHHENDLDVEIYNNCLLYTSPSPRDRTRSRMPSSA